MQTEFCFSDAKIITTQAPEKLHLYRKQPLEQLLDPRSSYLVENLLHDGAEPCCRGDVRSEEYKDAKEEVCYRDATYLKNSYLYY